jgi:hypothetical protein
MSRSGKKAISLLDETMVLDTESFTRVRVWEVPEPVMGSTHFLKYSLAYVRRGECEIRFDNERGKGDHYHLRGKEIAYVFESPEGLYDDFVRLVQTLRSKP